MEYFSAASHDSGGQCALLKHFPKLRLLDPPGKHNSCGLVAPPASYACNNAASLDVGSLQRILVSLLWCSGTFARPRHT